MHTRFGRFRPPCSRRRSESYFKTGMLVLPGFLSSSWLSRLLEVTDHFIERSKGYTEVLPLGVNTTDDPLKDKLVLAEGHCAEEPRLTRLSSPVDLHETYWQYATEIAAGIAADLVGPNVRFHHSKLNFKWPSTMEKVHWHQDIQFWPHTNYTPLTIGVYLHDTTEDMGPMHVVPLSVHDELFPLVDDDSGEFTGVLSERALAQVPMDSAVSTPDPEARSQCTMLALCMARCPTSPQEPGPSCLTPLRPPAQAWSMRAPIEYTCGHRAARPLCAASRSASQFTTRGHALWHRTCRLATPRHLSRGLSTWTGSCHA